MTYINVHYRNDKIPDELVNDKDSICVLDVETTGLCEIGNNPANPFYKDNGLVCVGFRKILPDPDKECSVILAASLAETEPKLVTLGEKNITKDFFRRWSKLLKPGMLVGQNIKFDLLWLYRFCPEYQEYVARNVKIWDIQLAEYILTGQEHKWASLDEMSDKYGLPTKPSHISEEIKAGKILDLLKRDVLEYNDHDLYTTARIFEAQIKLAEEKGLLQLCKSQMNALLATTDMQHNGIFINRTNLSVYSENVNDEIIKIKLYVKDSVEKLLLAQGKKHFVGHFTGLLDSPKKLGTFLFGGDVEYTQREQRGMYKNGKPKFVSVKKKEYVSGLGLDLDKSYITDKNNVSTADYVLQDLLEKYKLSFLETILRYRELEKISNTYIDKTNALLCISNDWFLHGNIHHCSTDTGRTSSSEPNLQNQPNNAFKSIYTSRYGDEGSLIEVDFSQLELVALALVSKDVTLILDIKQGVDMHTELYKSLFGKVPTEQQRKDFKTQAVFPLVYGAGPVKIAEQCNVSLNTAKVFIQIFYDRYPGVQAFHKYMLDSAKAKRVPTPFHSKAGLPIGKYIYTCPLTGRNYVFYESDVPWDQGSVGFQPPELKNYPIQGFATGDIVPLALGVLYRKLYSSSDSVNLYKDVKLVATVHDSILLDVHDKYKQETVNLIKKVLSDTHLYFEKYFGKSLALDFKFKIKVGTSWFYLEELELQ